MKRASWRESRLLVVDVELTGLDRDTDELIAFGAVPIERGRIVAGAMLEGLVRPRRQPSLRRRLHRSRSVSCAAAG